jgi:hypothetical protein
LIGCDEVAMGKDVILLAHHGAAANRDPLP